MAPVALRIHQLLPCSLVNGPGRRAVLWVQGCSLGCPGCFNPQTHPFAGGEPVAVDELFRRVQALGDDVEGITISGGEPLQQPGPLLGLLRRVRRETPLSVILFTGYTLDEVVRQRGCRDVLDCVDVLLAGRYDAGRHLGRDLRGSANKRVHFLTDRYTMRDLELVPAAEVILTPDGDIVLSGIDPLTWHEPLVQSAGGTPARLPMKKSE